MTQGFLTLSQYQRMVGDTLRMNPDLQGAWVMAELSDVRVSGGHCYMELMEKDEAGAMRAKMRGVIWRGSFDMLRRKFMAATNMDIRSGMKVLVRGSVNHHEVYGMSFVVSDIDPSYTLGDMERLRREILERLKREGLADKNRGMPAPEVPQRIAVISAEGAAGYGDFVNQLAANPRGFVVYTMLFPAVMQGERTVPTVMAALDWVESFRNFFDCVVIIRGGGATTDLNSFDNYELAARICGFPMPVVVGIGHERDRTVLDELACVRCKTPTAVAAWILERLDTYYTRMFDGCRRVGHYVSDAMKGERMRLVQIEASLPAMVSARTMRARIDLQQRAARMASALQGKTANAATRIQLLAGRVDSSARAAVSAQSQRLEKLDAMQRLLSPMNTLRRGYSITRVNGRAVNDANSLKPGDELSTVLLHGNVNSIVK